MFGKSVVGSTTDTDITPELYSHLKKSSLASSVCILTCDFSVTALVMEFSMWMSTSTRVFRFSSSLVCVPEGENHFFLEGIFKGSISMPKKKRKKR